MIQVPVGVFAKYWRNQRTTPLKQIKHMEKAENSIPFKYYRTAVASICRYHKSGNDPSVFRKTQSELMEKLAVCEKPGRAIILRNNIRAISLYESHFGKRKFEIRPIPKLKILAANVVVSAKLDMHVFEGDSELLIKLDMCRTKMNPTEVRSVLGITTEAAKKEGFLIPASNILMLRLHDGSESEGEELTSTQLRDFKTTGQTIENIWSEL